MLYKNKIFSAVFVVFVLLIVGGVTYWKKYDGTPFVVGSGEYVGFDAARANGFKSMKECSADPEFSALVGYVVGCERYFK